MKSRLTIKQGQTVLAEVEGRELNEGDIRADLQNVITIEQTLERLFGLRFHINVEDSQ